jgi:hypothetical protein
MILAAALGDMPIGRVILGNDVSEHFAPVWDDFNRSDRDLDADGTWVDCGPSVDYRACIEAGKLRINIPDGLSTAFERVSYMRYEKARAADNDGHIECQVAARGDYWTTPTGESGYATGVFAKVPADSFNDGVGIYLRASRLFLAVRRNGADRLVADFGNFAVGDIIRCNFAGPTYTMYCKGQNRGSWSDGSGQVATSDSHRSLGIRVHGAKEVSGTGPRRFSPALDYVEYA